ncbi:MAG: thiamine-phosphate kinase [Sulfuricella sp.]
MTSENNRIGIALEEAARAGVLRGGALEVLCGADGRDDCAVLRMDSERDLVIGSDFVRGTGFHLFKEGVLTHEDIGWYLAAANISDLAAMGARPAGIVIAMRWANDLTDEQWQSMHRGICGACREFDVPLLGGDSGGNSENVLSASAIGTVPHNRALLRSAGCPGDRLFLTGTVGAAGAAIAYFYRGRHQGVQVDSATEQRLADSWRRVRPAVAQGIWLSESGCCRCALDTSDGLKAGLSEIAARSNVDVVLRADAVPVDPAVRVVAEAMKLRPLELAISDSVDFRLLFSVSEEHVPAVVDEFSRQGWELHEIGWLRAAIEKEPRVVLNGRAGDEELPGIPWDQSDTTVVDRLLRV